jgi:serine/threonine-protein kinase
MAVGAEAQGGGQSGGVEGLSGSNNAFGKYQLFASLGRGGMADVFLAVARGPMGFNKLAVVKRLRAQLADDPSFRTMFLDEARLAARLNHPNVVHTYEVGEQDSIYFIAMEYLEGQALNKVISEAVKTNKVFDEVVCARIVSDALSGLHHAHDLKDYDGRPLQIIHRDISPHNVFVTYGGVTKLVDFGIAKAALSSTETEVGVLKGKVAYMSPEQAMAGPIDQRSDLFAMGIVLWELLTRQRLMTGDSAAATLHRLLNSPIPTVSSVRADVDPELDAIVAKALEKDPKYRFQDALEMRDALDTFIASSGKGPRVEDVGHTLSAMFQSTREEVQKQIQVHMEKIANAPPPESAVMGKDNINKFAGSGLQTGGSLPQLIGVSGSGSGVVPNYAPQYNGSVGQSIPPRADGTSPAISQAQQHEEKKSSAVLMIIAAILAALLLGVIALVVIGLKHPQEGTQTGPVVTGSGNALGGAQIGSQAGSQTGAQAGVQGNGVATTAQGGAMGMQTGAGGSSGATPSATDGASANSGSTASTDTPTTKHHGGGSHPQPAHTAAPATATTPAAPAAEDGYLTLDTYPWTKVSDGSKVLGSTPLVHVALSAGSHTLTLENPDQGIKQQTTLTIKAGETVSKRLGLK